MSPGSLVFHTIVTVELISKMFYWVYNTNGLRQYTRLKSLILIYNQKEGRNMHASGSAHLPVHYIYTILKIFHNLLKEQFDTFS